VVLNSLYEQAVGPGMPSKIKPQVRKALAGLDADSGVSVEGLLKQALKALMKQ
jgi:hypothetical protein